MKHMTRKEIFMAALAKGEEAPIEPLTREEQLLAAHARREANGSSGGSSGGASKPLGGNGVAYVRGNMLSEPISEEDTEKVVDAYKSGKSVYMYMPYKDSSESALYIEPANNMDASYSEADENGYYGIDLNSNTMMCKIKLTAEQMNEIATALVEFAKKDAFPFELYKNDEECKLRYGSGEQGSWPITPDQFDELIAHYENKFGTTLMGDSEE